MRVATLVVLAVGGLLPPDEGAAQWTNRYPRVAGYGHHVYLEGYELPLLASGPTDPAPAPDGLRVAFAARGWIWLLDLRTGVATRLTRGAEMDSRPSWSPDGRSVALVRDNDHETRVVIVDAATGADLRTIDSPAIDLDPVFTPDGSAIVYSSARAGTLDLWRHDLETGDEVALTNTLGLELRPQPHPDGTRLLYLAKGGGLDRVLLSAATPISDIPPLELMGAAIASMARPALAPDGQRVALNWPTESGWELRLLDVDHPGRWVRLAADRLPLTPAWSPGGDWIYFTEADHDETMRLRRIRPEGGPVEAVPVRSWDWGEPTATLRIRTVVAGAGDDPGPSGGGGARATTTSPARLSVLDASGHPAVPRPGAPFFDGQSGRVFFYSPGTLEVTVPAGEVRVSAVRGLTTPEATTSVSAAAGRVTEVTLELRPVWNARAAGWSSADHHFHLNYGGPYDLDPEDLLPMMAGESLHLATPLVANLHDRFESQDLWGWQSPAGGPLVRFGQEIRSHFLGHMGLIETQDLYWPWVWGPGYQVYGRDDRTNGEVLEFAHARGGLGYYVHPVGSPDPFSESGRSSVPVELVVDAVLGDVDAIEIVCLWSNPIGTAAVWQRFLSLGIPIAPSAGTDVMTNFYRTMAVGTARVYARSGEGLNWPAYIEAYKAGRSFVTNGPLLDFRVGNAGPGDVVTAAAASAGPVEWELDLRSAVPVERVEVLVNGAVVWSDSGLTEPGHRAYRGRLDLPSGGWMAVRALGGERRWPMMDASPFAHSGAVWIGAVGISDPEARRTAAAELLLVLEVAENRLIGGYGDAEIPKLRARFRAARERLESLAAR